MRWLKRLGRWAAIVTHEDRDLPDAQVLAVLLVRLPDEHHLAWSLLALRRRFPQALVSVLAPEGTTAPGEGSDPLLDVHRLPARRYHWQLLRQLRRWRHEQLSAVVLLSLHPLTTAAACQWFHCNRLLFNRWGQWFFVRRRTAVEWLTGRPGADRPEDARWSWTSPQAAAVRAIARWCAAPWRLLRWCGRAMWLVGYVGAALARVGWRRLTYRQQTPLHSSVAEGRTHAGA